MKTALDVCEKLVALYDSGVRPQVILGMHREEEDFLECVRIARELVERNKGRCAQENAIYAAALEDACPMGQNA